MSQVDVALICVFALAAFDGWRRGFIVHVADVLTLLPAIWLTISYSQEAADWLVLNRGMNLVTARFAAPVGIFVGFQVVAGLVVHMLSKLIPAEIRDSKSNHVAGVVPALLKYGVYASVVLAMVAAVPTEKAQAAVKDSSLAPQLASVGRTVTSWFGFDVNAAVGRAYKQMTVMNRPHPTTHDPITISPITSDAKLRVEPALEEKMLELVNAERAKAGAGPLVMDDRLRAVAREHSRDMWKRGYFAHEQPGGGDVADRVKAADISFQLVGENIALAPTLEMSHEGLMNSDDHRANILDKRYKRVGIGIILGGSNGLMVTQNFRD